jgi:acyl-CoA synthetase (AMP-forming)/AMP-acid ligase II
MRLHDQLDRWAEQTPESEFAVHGSRGMTWREAWVRVNRLANALVALDLPVGVRVPVLARNSIEYVLLYYAASRASVVPVPLNYRSAPPEWIHAIRDCQAGLVIADSTQLAAVDAIRSDLPQVRRFAALDEAVSPGWVSLAALAQRQDATPPAREASENDDLYQLYTSGTTGLPKGAVLTHRAVTANCAQIAAMPHRGAPGERSLVAAPLCHAGAVWSAFAPQQWGASLVIVDAVNPVELVRTLDEDQIGYASLAPSILHMCLTDVPDVAARSYRHLRLIHTGSAPVPQPLLHRAITAFGCDVVVGYGMTEASAGTSAMTPADTRRGLTDTPRLLASVGRPLPGTQVQIVDAAGTPLPIGEIGEITVRGPQLMRGYWHRPDATAETLRASWLHTGDAGHLDNEGYLYITDRIKDMIISGGLNVYPRMVEDVLHSHPAVAEAAVVGAPDERWGETVRAIVVPRAGALLNPTELLTYCGPRLGTHQRPRSVAIVDALPRTATGKVRKCELRERHRPDHRTDQRTDRAPEAVQT